MGRLRRERPTGNAQQRPRSPNCPPCPACPSIPSPQIPVAAPWNSYKARVKCIQGGGHWDAKKGCYYSPEDPGVPRLMGFEQKNAFLILGLVGVAFWLALKEK